MILEYAITTGFLLSDEAEVDTLTLEDMRQLYSPKQWRRLIEEQYPDEDPDEQYSLCLQEKEEAFNHYHKVTRPASCIMKAVKIRENPKNGNCSYGFAHCGSIHCEECGPYTVKKFIEKMDKVIAEGNIREITVNNKERARLVRKYDNYKSIPQKLESGEVVYTMYIQTDDPIGIPCESITEEKAWQLLQPVYSHKQSGKLLGDSKPSPSEEKEDSILDPLLEVTTQIQHVDFSNCNLQTGLALSNEKWAEITIKLAILKTIDLNPTNQRELNKSLYERRQARLEIFEKIGAVIFHVDYTKNILRESELCWQNTTEQIIKEQEELERWLKKLTC